MQQSDALLLLKSGFSVFLTGQAGAGKTYVLNQYIQYLRKNNIPVAITASTGIAATHMNGVTIHSWSGIGIKDVLSDKDFALLEARDGFAQKIKDTKVLIIDEVSMLHARQLDLVDEVLRHFSKDSRPFGGKQVVFSGDFFQLPPVGKKDETTKDKFAFMSKAWIALATTMDNDSPQIKVCYLTEQHRQVADEEDGLSFNDILNQIRNQNVSAAAIAALQQTKTQDIGENPTKLYTHNANVEMINQSELAKLTTEQIEFVAQTTGDDKLVDMLIKNVRSPQVLHLKKGAKVMFTKNNALEQYYNGTMGEVTRFVTSDGQKIPEVTLRDGRRILANAESWQIEAEDGTILAEFRQIPLMLAWAITVHKSQGMTLDVAEIDLSKTFEMGQGYVALSRVKSLSGLKLLGMNQKSLLLDSFAQTANHRFFALSCECENWLRAQDESTLQNWQQQFIKLNAFSYGATNTPNKPAINHDIYQTLITLIKDNKPPLLKLATTLNLSQSSVLDYINSALQNDSLSFDDIDYLKPTDSIISSVQSANQQLMDMGHDEPSSKEIFDKMSAVIQQSTIKLALIFLSQQADD